MRWHGHESRPRLSKVSRRQAKHAARDASRTRRKAERLHEIAACCRKVEAQSRRRASRHARWRDAQKLRVVDEARNHVPVSEPAHRLDTRHLHEARAVNSDRSAARRWARDHAQAHDTRVVIRECDAARAVALRVERHLHNLRASARAATRSRSSARKTAIALDRRHHHSRRRSTKAATIIATDRKPSAKHRDRRTSRTRASNRNQMRYKRRDVVCEDHAAR